MTKILQFPSAKMKIQSDIDMNLLHFLDSVEPEIRGPLKEFIKQMGKDMNIFGLNFTWEADCTQEQFDSLQRQLIELFKAYTNQTAWMAAELIKYKIEELRQELLV